MPRPNLFANPLKFLDQAGHSFSTRHALFAVLILTGTSLLAYLVNYSPFLTFDDWGMARQSAFSGMSLAQFLDRRPLYESPVAILNWMFGFHIPVFSLALLVVNVATGYVLYRLVITLAPQERLFALLTACIALVHPIDTMHMFVTTLGGRTGLMLAMLSLLLLAQYSLTGGKNRLAGSCVLVLLSLMMYELHTGLFVAGVFLIVMHHYRRTGRLKASLFIPVILAGFYAVWRTIGYLIVGIPDYFLTAREYSIFPDLSRIISLYKNQVFAWLEPIRPMVPASLFPTLMITGLAAVIVVVILGFSGKRQGRLFWMRGYRMHGIFFLLGLVLVFSGFIPIIAFCKSSLFQTTYLNMAMTVGGSLLLTSSISLFLCITCTERLRNRLFPVIAGGFIVYGVIIQQQIAKDDSIMWSHQKQIWQSMFTLIPDMEKGTHIVCSIDGSGFRNSPLNHTLTWPPLATFHQIDYALKALYNTRDISAAIHSRSTYLDTGVIRESDGVLIDFSRVIVVKYSLKERSLRIVYSLDELGIPGHTPGYDPGKRILATRRTSPYRYLVAG